MGEAQELEEARIKPFDRLSSIQVQISWSSEADIEYIIPIGDLLSPIGISWSTYRCGGSLSAPFLANRGRRSWYWVGTRLAGYFGCLAGFSVCSRMVDMARAKIAKLLCLVAYWKAAHEIKDMW